MDLSSGLTNGGPITILWGLCLVTFCNICVAVSLGELVSAMPTALGQAYWVYRLWHTPLGRFVSYMTAWTNVSALLRALLRDLTAVQSVRRGLASSASHSSRSDHGSFYAL